MSIYMHSGIALNQLSDLEQDTLSHYPGKPRPQLIKAFRGGVMVFHNILPDLWEKGCRVRIVPQKQKLTDIPECADLKGRKNKTGDSYDGDSIRGLCRWGWLVVIREEELLFSRSVSKKYEVFIHEVAHVIWWHILWEHERGYIRNLWKEEQRNRPVSDEYRLEDEFEFFAEGFLYYVTPYRAAEILCIREFRSPFGTPMREIEHEMEMPNKETLREVNIKLFNFLQQRFLGIIEPELMMSKPEHTEGDELRWEWWSRSNLYLPVIHSQEGAISNW